MGQMQAIIACQAPRLLTRRALKQQGKCGCSCICTAVACMRTAVRHHNCACTQPYACYSICRRKHMFTDCMPRLCCSHPTSVRLWGVSSMNASPGVGPPPRTDTTVIAPPTGGTLMNEVYSTACISTPLLSGGV